MDPLGINELSQKYFEHLETLNYSKSTINIVQEKPECIFEMVCRSRNYAAKRGEPGSDREIPEVFV
jgi:hypothetical protein